MLEVKKYKCEVCGKVHNCEADANKCEKGHKVPKAVHTPEYPKLGSDGSNPSSVIVEFEDGSHARYYQGVGGGGSKRM